MVKSFFYVFLFVFCIFSLNSCSYFQGDSKKETVVNDEPVKTEEPVKVPEPELIPDKCESGYDWNNAKTKCLKTLCGNGTLGKSGYCGCNKGFYWNGDFAGCVAPDVDCKNLYGDFTISTGVDKQGYNQCDCKSGYEWDRADTTCVKTICGNGVFGKDGICDCNDGFVWNADARGCTTPEKDCINLYGENSYSNGIGRDGYNECLCKAGSKWNEKDKVCGE